MFRKTPPEPEEYSLDKNISVLEKNKQESFDGMRAYHESERDHLNNDEARFFGGD